MMTCDKFRLMSGEQELSPAALAHMRSCDACLSFAVDQDPDRLFQSLGGELEPPGGVEAFVGEVMLEVGIREKERRIEPLRRPHWTRWSIAAAAVLISITAGLFVINQQTAPVAVPTAAAVTSPAAQVTAPVLLAQAPVIESYRSAGAMIIEVPTEQDSDMKVVMIFDESLPVDL